MNLQWTNGLSVNNDLIDKEHQMYFDLLNRLYAENEQGAGRDKLDRLFNEFIQFVRFHFLVEENLMLDSGYSDYGLHKMAHRHALDTLKSKLFDFQSGKTSCSDVLDFAIEWFLMHISSQDKKFGEFLALQ